MAEEKKNDDNLSLNIRWNRFEQLLTAYAQTPLSSDKNYPRFVKRNRQIQNFVNRQKEKAFKYQVTSKSVEWVKSEFPVPGQDEYNVFQVSVQITDLNSGKGFNADFHFRVFIDFKEAEGTGTQIELYPHLNSATSKVLSIRLGDENEAEFMTFNSFKHLLTGITSLTKHRDEIFDDFRLDLISFSRDSLTSAWMHVYNDPTKYKDYVEWIGKYDRYQSYKKYQILAAHTLAIRKAPEYEKQYHDLALAVRRAMKKEDEVAKAFQNKQASEADLKRYKRQKIVKQVKLHDWKEDHPFYADIIKFYNDWVKLSGQTLKIDLFNFAEAKMKYNKDKSETNNQANQPAVKGQKSKAQSDDFGDFYDNGYIDLLHENPNYNNDYQRDLREPAIGYNENVDIFQRELFDLELLLISGILACFIGLFCFLAGIVIGKIHEKRKKPNICYPDSMDIDENMQD